MLDYTETEVCKPLARISLWKEKGMCLNNSQPFLTNTTVPQQVQRRVNGIQFIDMWSFLDNPTVKSQVKCTTAKPISITGALQPENVK